MNENLIPVSNFLAISTLSDTDVMIIREDGFRARISELVPGAITDYYTYLITGIDLCYDTRAEGSYLALHIQEPETAANYYIPEPRTH